MREAQGSAEGSAAGNYIASSIEAASGIDKSNIWKTGGSGTYIANQSTQGVIPLTGTFVEGSAFNAEFRNPHILSGIEFCDISGAPSGNQFSIFKIDPKFKVAGISSPLIKNTVIKCKSLGGLPRLRFDLSSYGDRRNYFIKDHLFKLNIKALVAEETSDILGGGELGVWIHTQENQNIIWSWTSKNKWEPVHVSSISIPKVLELSHKYYFDKIYDESDTIKCLNTNYEKLDYINNDSLTKIKENYFKNFEISFDTRNYTIYNNFEYLDVIPIKEQYFKLKDQIHKEDTNYIIEVFFVPNTNTKKYLLLDNIQLTDLTQKENSGIGTGFGLETSGIPLRRFVKENKIYLTREELRELIKFYNSLMGQGTGVYSTNIASKNSNVTQGILEVSGGSRLNYRIAPDWVPNTKNATYEQYTSLEFDN